MPTGYTAVLNDKPETTFEQFALRCARAMGALIMMRDDPMDAPIPNDVAYHSTYHEDSLKRAQANLIKFNTMTDEECLLETEREYESAVARYHEQQSEKTAQARNYGAMLGQVLAWKPPTPEHKGMKDFMERQLRESIEFDCYSIDKPVKADPSTWRQDNIAMAIRDIDYSTKQMEEEEERSRSRNEWVKALRDCLSTEI